MYSNCDSYITIAVGVQRDGMDVPPAISRGYPSPGHQLNH